MDIRVEYTNMKNRRIPTMEQIKIPDGYHSALNLHDTQIAIKTVKDFFQQTLSQKLNLLRVSAPVFVNPSSGSER